MLYQLAIINVVVRYISGYYVQTFFGGAIVEMLVSVIITHYNYGRYVEDAVKSVLWQNHPAVECLLVDDGSTDADSLAKCRELAAQHPAVVLYEKSNGGLSSARNYGISHAQGELVCCLDADDMISENFLVEAVAAFIKNKNLGIAMPKCIIFGDHLDIWDVRPKDVKDFFSRSNSIPCCCVYQRADWQVLGGFDEQLTYAEDYDFWIRVLAMGRDPVSLPAAQFYYRRHNIEKPSMMAYTKQDVIERCFFRIYTKNIEIFTNYFDGFVAQFIEKEREIAQLQRKLDKRWSWRFNNFLRRVRRKLVKPKILMPTQLRFLLK